MKAFRAFPGKLSTDNVSPLLLIFDVSVCAVSLDRQRPHHILYPPFGHSNKQFLSPNAE